MLFIYENELKIANFNYIRKTTLSAWRRNSIIGQKMFS